MLKARITAAEFAALSAELQKFYSAEADGHHILQVTPTDGYELADTRTLKQSLQKERTAKEAAEKIAKAFEGLDPDAAKDALKKVEEFVALDPEKKLEAQRKALEDSYNQKLAADKAAITKKYTEDNEKLSKRHSAATKQLEKALIEAAASQAIAKEKGRIPLLLPIVRQATRLKELDSGEFQVEVLGPDGTPRLSNKTGSTAPMIIEEYVAELKADANYAAAFDSSGGSGSGSTGSDGGRPGQKTFTLNAEEARDPARYAAAKAEAAKVGQEVIIAG